MRLHGPHYPHTFSTLPHTSALENPNSSAAAHQLIYCSLLCHSLAQLLHIDHVQLARQNCTPKLQELSLILRTLHPPHRDDLGSSRLPSFLKQNDSRLQVLPSRCSALSSLGTVFQTALTSHCALSSQMQEALNASPTAWYCSGDIDGVIGRASLPRNASYRCRTV